jgi:hypothetical protein
MNAIFEQTTIKISSTRAWEPWLASVKVVRQMAGNKLPVYARGSFSSLEIYFPSKHKAQLRAKAMLEQAVEAQGGILMSRAQLSALSLWGSNVARRLNADWYHVELDETADGGLNILAAAGVAEINVEFLLAGVD